VSAEPGDQHPPLPDHARPKRFLGLYAHPDDETFCSGGTFARYAAQGAEIAVVSATRGEAGQIRDATVATRRTIGRVREEELRLACRRLGVQTARCLDYPDGGLAAADVATLVGELTHIIRDFRPTAVFTFGPDGGYGHPDHVALGAAVTAAWERADDAAAFPEQLAEGLAPHAPDTLYYALFPPHRRRLLERMVTWLVSHEERFRGDAGFVTALLHLAEEARDLRSISDHIETRWFPAGTSVIEQGETATTLYLILSGEAEAVREHPDGAMELLGWLEPGHFFGETGIATGRPRNAHVIARSPLTCLLFSPSQPTPFLGRGAGAHLVDPIGAVTDDEIPTMATTRIDVGEVIDRKIAAIAAYRSQFAFDPDAIPHSLLLDLFGVEYFVRARPLPALESDIR
jgi:LmbE family N-acetylglucosaminyl deacetylase